MATDVPTAWAAVPIESPWAMGLLTRDSFIILKPVMPPNMPVHTTTAAVSAGMPPMACVTSMAIGVVTDFDASDMTTSRDAPSICATMTTDAMPTMHPATSARRMGRNCFFIDSS